MSEIKTAAMAMAALHTWSCVVAILESGADPGRMGPTDRRDVRRVIAIANSAQQRMLGLYDKSVARAAKERT
jgi:hypothetical protein